MPLSKINTLALADNAVVTADIANGAITSAKLASGVGGKVLQVVSTTKTDVFSMSSTTFADVTGFSVSITPSSASNKILILVNIFAGNNVNNSFARLMRDSTAICIGNANTDNIRASMGNYYTLVDYVPSYVGSSQNFLDSPNTTSSITYKLQLMAVSGTVYFNYGGAGETTNSRGRSASTITAIEIAG